jgi:predicted CxxxxCH...CXXCH cytochrome family protein
MVLVPNVNYPQYNYRIASNTSDTITIVSPPDAINLAYGGATFAVTYGRLIKEAIDGKPVRFFQKSGANSFADGTAVINGYTTYSVCQVCHTQAGQGAHPADRVTEDCTQCHSHAPSSSGGFMADCASCHGNPPTLATIGGPNGMASYDPPTNTIGTGSVSPNPGKHQKHAGSTGGGNLGYACDTCHTSYAMPEPATKTVDIGFANFGVGGGQYKGQAAVAYTGRNGTDVSVKDNSRTCNNLYCHSTVQSGADGTGAPTYKTPQWLDTATVVCGDCHNADGVQGLATTMDSGSHTPHLGVSGVTCDTCHAGNTHVDKNIDVTTGTYSQAPNTPGNGYGTCSTASCHTNVQADGGGAGSAVTTPTWGTATACGACHKGRKTDATTMDAGKHTKHLSYSQIDCANCHDGVGDGTPSHLDNNIDVVFNAASGSGGSYSQVPNAPGNGYGACSATYCHSQGQSTTSPYGGGPNTVPGWATASLDCKSCHNYTAASLSPMASGSHTAHVNDGAIMTNKSCDACHIETTSNGTSITDATLHVNQAKNVGITGTYDSNATPSDNFAANACNNVYCHSDGKTAPTYKSVTWGTTISDCVTCHDNANAATTLSGAHKSHTFGAGTTIGRNLGCEQCHADTATDSTTISAPANHVNKIKDIKVQIDNSACNNIQCHSDGNFDGTVTYNNPVWTATLGCVNCHGDGATKAYPSYADGNSGTSASNSHNKHVGSSSLNCEECHQGTSVSGTAIDGTAPAEHVNQTVNVAFKQGGSYNAPANEQCSATYCHGGATPTWGGAAINCDGCHDATNTGGLSTRHDKHYNKATPATDRTATNAHTATEYVFGCGNCHPDGATHATGRYDNVPTVLQDAEINGTKLTTGNYVPGAVTSSTDGRGYNYTNGGTCTTSCHSGGTVLGDAGSPYYKAPKWNDVPGGACNTCHNDKTATPMATNAHGKHIASATYNFACDECHGVTATGSATIADRNSHVNGANNVDWKTAGVNNGGTAYAGGGACGGIYCHSKGTDFTAPFAATSNPNIAPGWTATGYTCGSCHDGLPAGPSYVNGTPKANSHAKHTSSYTCEKCHYDTTTTGNTITAFANHPNQAYNVQQSGGTVTFTPTIGNPTTPTSCNTISCHGDNNATWGGASLKCSDCHLTATAQADVDNFNFSDGTAAKVSLDEWQYSGHGKTAGQYNITLNAAANLQAAAGTGDECLYCHDGVTFNHGDAGNPFRLRNFSDVTFGRNGNCLKCHATTGGTGVDPDGAGTTYANKTAAKKVDKYHNGNKHSASLTGGQFCWDCHDPHGDRTAAGGPIAMVHLKPFAASDVATGAPTAVAGTSVLFTDRINPSDFGKTSAPYNGVCNVCHTYKAADPNKMVHYTATSSDSHNSATICTQCHKHSADTVFNGDAYKGGGCNGCHDYDTRVAFNWGDGFTGQAVEGLGAHKKHIDHIKARFSVTLDPNADSFGTGAAAQVCGTCHTNTVGEHTTGGGTRLVNFGDGTYKEGGAAGFSFLFDPAATTGLPATLPRPQYNGVVGNSSNVNPKSCSAVGCHFQTTPVWSAY